MENAWFHFRPTCQTTQLVASSRYCRTFCDNAQNVQKESSRVSVRVRGRCRLHDAHLLGGGPAAHGAAADPVQRAVGPNLQRHLGRQRRARCLQEPRLR